MHHIIKNERQYTQLHKHSCLDFSKCSPLRLYPLAQNNADMLFFLWAGDRILAGKRFSAPDRTSPGGPLASYTMATAPFLEVESR